MRKPRAFAPAHFAARYGTIRASNARYVARPRTLDISKSPAGRRRSKPKPVSPAGVTSRFCIVKILHQRDDAGLDPVADDVATLALDILLRNSGFQRGAVNPFLLGY
jgi:hypothetical protein